MRKTGPNKAETDLLPPFDGLTLERIVIPDTAEAVAAAVAEIRAAGEAGFDTESKPTFKPGEASTGPHVVQFALAERAFLFQMLDSASRDAASLLLEDPAVLKIGFGLSADRSQIHAKLGATLQAVLDLDHLFRRRGYNSSLGARAAVGLVLGRNFRKSKSVTTTNWSLSRLSDAQKLYAANDAYAALRVYLALTLTPQERQALLPAP
ncbi:3'-5' exonuclease [Methyloversatilis discipulorum]|uniref:3'-5' exonuclease n=1 Tax=Methyloversatilis discipulorum TaxID=1119528 RepID=UPI001A61F4B2|nr:3'-5' exonuclease [Methyloversatilis discipulorum]MBL8470033.1 3'-5' exonuclease domain-containing protein 2 [Methyloversatilis discipulorum]